MKLASLLALVMAKGLGELQAQSSRVTSHDPAMSLASLPDFVAETVSKGPHLPRSFLVRSLEEFMGDFPEGRLLCDVQAVWTYLPVMSSIAPHPRLLLVSPRYPTRSLSKNALSLFLQQVILDAGRGGGCLAS